MEMFTKILIPLIATILIELGVLRLLGERSRRVLWSSVAVNILTNVPLNVWLHCLPSFDWTTILVGEAIVVVAEMFWYYYFLRSLMQAFIYAFLCNAISFLTGLMVLMIWNIVFYY